MITRRASSLLLTSFFALLAGPALSAQAAFSFGPPHYINFSSPVVVYKNAAFDMNGDGNTDLFVAFNTGMFIYVGDGKGNFAAPIPVGGTPNDYNLRGLKFYDVNGDGYDDEVFSSGEFSRNNINYPGVFAVLLGDGNGNFTQTTSIPNNYTGDYTNTPSIAAGDFNRDGKIDFVTVNGNYYDNHFHAAVNVYLNEGAGVFVSGFSAEILGNPTLPVVGDFNGDGNLDIVWLDGNPEAGTTNRFAVHCIYGNGDGTFQADQICYTLDGAPYAVAAADFNHDGMTDLLVLDSAKTGVSKAKPRLATLLAKKGGFFWSSALSLPLRPNGVPPSGSLQLMDFNGDGIPDAVANLGANGIFKGNPNGVFNDRVIVVTNAFTAPFFAPLSKGQLPTLFHIDNDEGDYSTQITFNLNTSPK